MRIWKLLDSRLYTTVKLISLYNEIFYGLQQATQQFPRLLIYFSLPVQSNLLLFVLNLNIHTDTAINLLLHLIYSAESIKSFFFNISCKNSLPGLLISIYPFIKAWLNINHILPSFGKLFNIIFIYYLKIQFKYFTKVTVL